MQFKPINYIKENTLWCSSALLYNGWPFIFINAVGTYCETATLTNSLKIECTCVWFWCLCAAVMKQGEIFIMRAGFPLSQCVIQISFSISHPLTSALSHTHTTHFVRGFSYPTLSFIMEQKMQSIRKKWACGFMDGLGRLLWVRQSTS